MINYFCEASNVGNSLPSFLSENPVVANFVKIAGQFLPFILIAVIFYFFLIRPQNKQREALNRMIDNLKVGDKVITKGGIVGTIAEIKENSLILQTYDGGKTEILKHAVISLIDENR